MTPHPIARLPEDWTAWLSARGERPFRALPLFRWIQARGVLDPARMTDLPEPLRAALRDEGLGPALTEADVRRSADGTKKLLLRMTDGATIESVLIP